MSSLADRFVLKGGLLLAILDAQRHTQDIDLQGRGVSGEGQEIIGYITQIASITCADGVEFDATTLRSSDIRDDDEYGGMRVVVPAKIGKSRANLRLDISFGDPITPGARRVDYPALLGGSFPVVTYPVETMLAEKITTALERREANTRVRDYADVWRLIGIHDLDGGAVSAAITATAGHRGIRLLPLADVVGGLAVRQQSAYAAWRRRQDNAEDVYPAAFTEVVGGVLGFTDPLLIGSVAGARWYAAERRWQPGDRNR